jgi:hypothetical protein
MINNCVEGDFKVFQVWSIKEIQLLAFICQTSISSNKFGKSNIPLHRYENKASSTSFD